MARPAEPNLALAATRPGGDEDTLTEVFAGVMEVDQQLAQEVLRLACGNEIEPASAVGVRTQYAPRRAHICKVDMWLDAGTTSCWIENKLEAQFGTGQLQRYSKLGPGLVIVPEKRRKEVPGGESWRVATWPDIANLARSLWDVDGTGESAARLPTAEARHKARADFISYLEERKIVSEFLRPLSTDDETALARASFVLHDAVPCILKSVRKRAEARGIKFKDWQFPAANRDYGYIVFHPGPTTWADDVGGLYETIVAGNPDFVDYPAVGVGLTVYDDPTNPNQDFFAGSVWQNELEIAGFVRSRVDLGWRAFRDLPPHELAGDALDKQAISAADEFMRAHDVLADLQDAWVDARSGRQE